MDKESGQIKIKTFETVPELSSDSANHFKCKTSRDLTLKSRCICLAKMENVVELSEREHEYFFIKIPLVGI